MSSAVQTQQPSWLKHVDLYMESLAEVQAAFKALPLTSSDPLRLSDNRESTPKAVHQVASLVQLATKAVLNSIDLQVESRFLPVEMQEALLKVKPSITEHRVLIRLSCIEQEAVQEFCRQQLLAQGKVVEPEKAQNTFYSHLFDQMIKASSPHALRKLILMSKYPHVASLFLSFLNMLERVKLTIQPIFDHLAKWMTYLPARVKGAIFPIKELIGFYSFFHVASWIQTPIWEAVASYAMPKVAPYLSSFLLRAVSQVASTILYHQFAVFFIWMTFAEMISPNAAASLGVNRWLIAGLVVIAAPSVVIFPAVPVAMVASRLFVKLFFSNSDDAKVCFTRLKQKISDWTRPYRFFSSCPLSLKEKEALHAMEATWMPQRLACKKS